MRIELAPATTYVMCLIGHGADPLTDPLLELYNADGQRVAWNDDLHQGVLHSQVVFTTPAADAQDTPLTYYLNARSYWLNPALRSDGDYELTLDAQRPLQAPAAPPAAPLALLKYPTGALTGTSGPDSLRGDAADNVLEGGPGPDVLDGGGQPPDGHGDSASYQRAASGVTVSLETRFGRTFRGDAEGDVLIDIENLIGSNYDDILTGDVGDNILLGGRGNDILDGGGGADLLLGGPGIDTVTYARNFSNHGVRVDLAAGVADGASAQGDRLAGVENLIGSASDDELYGSAESNRLWGGSHGDDLMTGRGGADVFVFHEDDGHDTVTDFDPGEDLIELHQQYIDWQALAIEADGADTVIRTYQHSSSLRLLGVAPEELGEEHFVLIGEPYPEPLPTDSGRPDEPAGLTLTGGSSGDVLTGGDGDDVLEGGDGDDVLEGGDGYDTLRGGPGDDTMTGGDDNDDLDGGPGADALDGGAGFDFAWYLDSPAGVTIDLSSKDGQGYSTGSGGHAQGDRLKNIEGIWGSAHDDTLTGDGHNNFFYGREGNDTLAGGAGMDTLIGGYGDDWLYGGPGADTLAGDSGADVLDGGANDAHANKDSADYSASPAGVTIDLSSKDSDGYSTGSGGHAQGDKLKNIESITGSPYNDTLTGDDTRNHLTGSGGNDTLSGGGGNDTLSGGGGNDTLSGGPGTDAFIFHSGDGSDLIVDFTQGDDLIDLQSFNLIGIGDTALTITPEASDTVISVGDISITLQGFTGTLDAGDFLF